MESLLRRRRGLGGIKTIRVGELELEHSRAESLRVDFGAGQEVRRFVKRLLQTISGKGPGHLDKAGGREDGEEVSEAPWATLDLEMN